MFRAHRFSVAPPRGVTLLEVTVALMLTGLAFGVALSPLRAGADRWATRAAREAVVAVLARARAEAQAGARVLVTLDANQSLVEARSAGRALARVDLPADYGVRLDLGADRESVELTFAALGLGRVASRTLVFARGDARAVLKVSSYGRVSR